MNDVIHQANSLEWWDTWELKDTYQANIGGNTAITNADVTVYMYICSLSFEMQYVLLRVFNTVIDRKYFFKTFPKFDKGRYGFQVCV